MGATGVQPPRDTELSLGRWCVETETRVWCAALVPHPMLSGTNVLPRYGWLQEDPLAPALLQLHPHGQDAQEAFSSSGVFEAHTTSGYCPADSNLLPPR